MSRDEFVSPQKEQQEAEKFSVLAFFRRDYIIRDFLKKEYPFILFLLFLSMFYIWNSYKYEAENKRLKKEKKALAVLKFKSMELQADLMKFSRQSQVLRKIKERQLGLELSSDPPVILNKVDE